MQSLFVDRLTIQESPIGRVAVTYEHLPIPKHDLAVMGRNGRVFDLKIVGRAASKPV